MEQKKSEFDKVLGAWDILVIAFGAMIGWGWVVSSGSWIQKGGVVGASIAFAHQYASNDLRNFSVSHADIQVMHQLRSLPLDNPQVQDLLNFLL